MGGFGVIFDVDGVLIDSYQSHFESWRLVAAEIGRLMTEAEFARGFGRTSREIIADLWSDRTWLPDEIRQLDDRKESLFRGLIRRQFPAMPGAADLIRSLSDAGFKVAVGSSGPPENVATVIERLGAGNLIECRITGRDVTRGKPDPQVFQLAAQGLGLPPDRCCVVEDAPVGIQAAHGAGIVCVGFASTGRTREELKAAETVVDALGELSPDRFESLIRAGLSSR